MSRTLTALAVLTLLLGGCRTYGGYGSEEQTYEQIEDVVGRFESELTRARSDLQQLEAAADTPYGGVVAAQYGYVVAGHEAVLDEHKDLAADLSGDSDYRSLHRAFGAIVTEQHLVRTQYQGVLRYAYDALSTDSTDGVASAELYSVVPPYYTSLAASDDEVTVREVVERVSSGTSLREGFRLQMPRPASMDVSSDGHGDSEGHGASTGH